MRYEDETYSELKKLLPNKKALVKTCQGCGKVIDKQILTQLVMVEHALFDHFVKAALRNVVLLHCCGAFGLILTNQGKRSTNHALAWIPLASLALLIWSHSGNHGSHCISN